MTRPTSSPLRIAIVGGGFTGAVLAIHAVRASSVQLDLVILEPRAELGRGVAYSTRDRSHRINVPSDRLDIAAETPGAVTAWLHANGFLPDAASQDEAGGAYVP